jgi:hypothetical protein
MKGRWGLVATVLVGGALLLPSTAAATHKHALTTGNGNCVILAPNGGESDLTLPDAALTGDPTIDVFPHPLHINVHWGEAGQHIDIAVLGSDDCTSYLNGP